MKKTQIFLFLLFFILTHLSYSMDYMEDFYDDEEENMVIGDVDIEQKSRIVINIACNKQTIQTHKNNIVKYKFYNIEDNSIIAKMDSIYNKIMDNLTFLDFLDYEYNKDYCNDINSFFQDFKNSKENDYINSNIFSSAEFVLTSYVNVINENVFLNVNIWDILEGEIVFSSKFLLNIDDISTIANKISDLIFKAYTGEQIGIFDSKILYLAKINKNSKARDKQLIISNFDGTNSKIITNDNDIKLSPMFSRENKNEIYYTKGNRQDGFFVNKIDLETKQTTKIALKNNILMTTASTFSPNGDNIVLAGTDDKANTNLFLYNLKDKSYKQLTFSKSINTSPSYNEDGTKIVFVGDDTGSRKLYVLDLMANKKQQITKENGTYDKPSWSPDGKLIAFIKISKNKFLLGLINEYGEGERYLLSDYFIDNISWSPNSRYLIYTKKTSAYGEGAISRIYIMDVITGKETKINTGNFGGVSDADWIINE